MSLKKKEKKRRVVEDRRKLSHDDNSSFANFEFLLFLVGAMTFATRKHEIQDKRAHRNWFGRSRRDSETGGNNLRSEVVIMEKFAGLSL